MPRWLAAKIEARLPTLFFQFSFHQQMALLPSTTRRAAVMTQRRFQHQRQYAPRAPDVAPHAFSLRRCAARDADAQAPPLFTRATPHTCHAIDAPCCCRTRFYASAA